MRPERLFFIVGYEPSAVANDGIGNLFLAGSRGHDLIYVSNVGTGFSERDATGLRKDLDKLKTSWAPVTLKQRGVVQRKSVRERSDQKIVATRAQEVAGRRPSLLDSGLLASAPPDGPLPRVLVCRAPAAADDISSQQRYSGLACGWTERHNDTPIDSTLAATSIASRERSPYFGQS